MSVGLVGTALDEVLDQGIGGVLQLFDRAQEIEAPLVEVGDAVGGVKGGLHVVGHHDRGGAEPFLQAADEPVLFGLTNVWTFHLTISAAEWDRMGSRGGPQRMNNGNGDDGVIDGIVRGFFGNGNDNGRRVQAQQPQTRQRTPAIDGNSRYPWVRCVFEGAGQRITNATIRFKGVSSLVRAPNAYKRPFKIDFNRLDKEQRFLGVQELYLNNNVNDATQMREAIAYDLFRQAGVAAPRTAFARVYLTIPGLLEKQNLGLYTLVEVVEGDFLKRSFGSKKGLLVRPESMQGLEYMGDNWDAYPGRYHPKGEPTAEEARQFMEFVRFIHDASPAQFSAHLSDYLDTDSFAKFIALNAILTNVDSFIGNGHNYFLYTVPSTHKAVFVPWDLNESFGMHPVSGPSGDQMLSSMLRPNADPNLLVERFVRDQTFGPKYRAQCVAILTNIFVPSKLAKQIDQIAAVTKPVVFSESRRAREDFERTVLKTMGPDDGDTSQPRRDSEFRRDSFHQ